MKNPLILLLLSFLLFTDLYGQPFRKIWSKPEYGNDIGKTGCIYDDIDDDGNIELVFTGGEFGYNQLFLVRRIDDKLVHAGMSSLYKDNVVTKLLYDRSLNTGIVAILKNGRVDIFTSALQLSRSFETDFPEVTAAAIADLNYDGNAELILVSLSGLKVLDLMSGSQIFYSDVVKGTQVVIGDVDNSAGEDIVVSSTLYPGYVISGADFTTQWAYAPGFGTLMQLIDADHDGKAEIYGVRSDSVIKFDATKNEVLVGFNTKSGITLFTAQADIDQDGVNEFIQYRPSATNGILCYNVVNGELVSETVKTIHTASYCHVNQSPSGIFEVLTLYPYYISIQDLQSGKTISLSDGVKHPFSADFLPPAPGQTEDIIYSYTVSATWNEKSLVHRLDPIHEQHKLSAFDFENGVIRAKEVSSRYPQQREIMIVKNEGIFFYDSRDHSIIATLKLPEPHMPLDVVCGDLDNDGRNEILIASTNSYFYVYNFNGSEYVMTYKSDNLISNITDMIIENVDDDPQNEIIIGQASNGKIKIIDGLTFLIENELSNIYLSRALVTGDVDGDGKKELLVAYGKNLNYYNLPSLQLKSSWSIGEDVTSIAVANIDSTLVNEIITLGNDLRIFNFKLQKILYTSQPLAGAGNHGLQVCDMDEDDYAELILTLKNGIEIWESENKAPYLTLPAVTGTYPKPGSTAFPVNGIVRVFLSERIDPLTIGDNYIRVISKSQGITDINTAYDDLSAVITISKAENWIEHDTVFVYLDHRISDLQGNWLDGNSNGIVDSTEVDDYIFSFVVGEKADEEAPMTVSLNIYNPELYSGTDLNFQIQVRDDASEIRAAEYFVDVPGVSGHGNPIQPDDLLFDSREESLTAGYNTFGLQPGPHTLFVHAMDEGGKWGTLLEKSFSIIEDYKDKWATLGHNYLRTAYNASSTLSPPFKAQWQRTLAANGSLNELAIVDDHIYTTYQVLDKRMLECLDIHDGKSTWKNNIGNNLFPQSVSYAYGNIYYVANKSPNGYLNCVDMHTGKVIWSSLFPSQFQTIGPPLIYKQDIFINGGYYGGIVCMDALDGKHKWSKNEEYQDRWSPTAYNDIVYYIIGNQMKAVFGNSGNYLGSANLDFSAGLIGSPISVVIDTVNKLLLGTTPNSFEVFDITNHHKEWGLMGLFDSNPALFNDSVLVNRDGNIECRDIKTGALYWVTDFENDFIYAPAVNRAYIFASSADNTYVLNKADGTYVSYLPHGGESYITDHYLIINDKKSKTVFAYADMDFVGIHTGIERKDSLKVYPNPASEELTIELLPDRAGSCDILLYDVSGREVYSSHRLPSYSAGQNHLKLNVSRLTDGVYFLVIRTGNDVFQKKIIIVH